MESIKYWEIEKNINEVQATNDIQLLLKKISNGHNFIVKDKRKANEMTISKVDSYYASSAMEYTNFKNPIIISENEKISPNIISSEYYKKYENLIIDNKFKYFHIKREAKLDLEFYTTDILILLLSSNDIDKIFIYDVNLTDEEIKLIIKSKKNVYVKDKCIDRSFGNGYMFGNNSLSTLQIGIIDLDVRLWECEFNNLSFATNNTRFNIDINKNTPPEKLDLMLNNLKKVINKLNENELKSKVIVNIESRELLTNEVHKLLKLYNDSYVILGRELKYEQYVEVNNYLEYLVKGALDKGYSPLEKYLYLYNVVKRFKEYKENPDDPWDSRDIDKFLFNEYMVCVGYAKLLEELLSLAGIESSILDVDIDESYDDYDMNENIKEQEGKVVNSTAHARLLVYIKDEKYNINGYYQSDPTWDNNMNYDCYQHALGTMSSTRYSKRLFELSKTDLILDFDDMNDFYNKINHYLNRYQVYQLDDNYNNFESQNNTLSKVDVLRSYEYLCSDMIEIIEGIDKELYNELNIYYINLESEDSYKEFITLFGKKVITKTNNEIEKDLLYTAIYNVKVIEDERFTLDDINSIRNFNEEMELLYFPYKK